MSGVTEFISFPVSPGVKPEDPANEPGAALLDHFRAAKQQAGYLSSAWGRTVEDEGRIVWVIDWKDAHSGTGSTATTLSPFLPTDNDNQPSITTLFATLTPPLANTLPTNPITELFTPSFPTTISGHEAATATATAAVHENMISFRRELLENLPAGTAGPVSFSMGQVERPGVRKHAGSPSGEAWGMVVVAGWESLEAHLEAKKTEAFGRGIQPLREVMLKGVGGEVVMRHVVFRGVE
ncbi:hypothetical protein BO70DRAFT_389711 [Aspergillus heteromorphus CBS 117.55]|uniref:ABM domain-containing protein n=1 Tax=Aspergillus heteromorphus CBS 117.55 TaxID=1448321 RepID=A0A317VD13_9EURO|nr:uncharacterized protein BO70DRAFT_389711 [Aspergillus heteromorphus CBS 117.55]PWY70967.1 hypothetical protein BO70DRAFT_389711 [Aspergillus heteromorphus CBS 117.55]